MTNEKREKIIQTIVARERLRPLGRTVRLFKDPVRAFPYYLLAAASHAHPYRISWKTLWGDRMSGFLPESNTFYYYGYCEAGLTSFLLRYLEDGMTFVDVGAHIGFYSALASRLVGSSGKVYSFEPTPWTYRLLEENTKGLENATGLNAGASDMDGRVIFSDHGPGYGAYNSASAEGTMLHSKAKTKAKKIEVPVINLDHFCKEKGLVPNFIKLDAEGFEHKILDGMAKLLSGARPLITLEMAGDEIWAENRRRSSDTLLAAGYEPFEMSVEGYLKRCGIKASYRYDNLLFVPQEKTTLVADLIR